MEAHVYSKTSRETAVFSTNHEKDTPLSIASGIKDIVDLAQTGNPVRPIFKFAVIIGVGIFNSRQPKFGYGYKEDKKPEKKRFVPRQRM